MPSDVLARTCFVTRRDEDPQQGFQRVLDKGRAQQIADYIDSGFGTIPNSIVLSAQPEAHLRALGRAKTIEFNDTNRAFLVLDGQHRVYGFSLAHTPLRVPVVIYNGLTRQDETRLFIDINTKQRPVPNELLLDIKRQAAYENDQEALLGTVFDYFADRPDSPLLGLMSAATRSGGKISRVTFYSAFKPLIAVFSDLDADGIYSAVRAYLRAFLAGVAERKLEVDITNPTVFRAIMMLFPEVARLVKDRYAAEYTDSHFADVMSALIPRLRSAQFRKPGSSPRALFDTLLKALRSGFTL